MKTLIHIARILVGVLFIFSGFVKLVDPIGSQYKFQEYFSEGVLNMEFLIPYALPFAILLILAETLLGVMLLIGYKPKITLSSLFVITLIFLFLTWYSAYYNKVTDCGCFGDAIKLSPWETFYKNVILLLFIIFLVIKRSFLKPLFKRKIPKLLTFVSLAAFLYVAQHVLIHLPLIDFRPYAIGKNISKGMEYKDDGEIPPVHDFMLEDAQNDLAPEILAKENVMLIILYNLEKSDESGFPAIKKVSEKALKNGYTVYGVSASFTNDLLAAKEKHQLPFEFFFCDETTLKTMIRANPGIIILDKGTVIDKKNFIDADKIKL
jgi:uncharacterized membrane protein YphA (DoxX/SURF4 family)|tara:strand:- start:8520 stop:9482 length:963 start_codon:yes stop_codon:yes gene_type:complete